MCIAHLKSPLKSMSTRHRRISNGPILQSDRLPTSSTVYPRAPALGIPHLYYSPCLTFQLSTRSMLYSSQSSSFGLSKRNSEL